MNASRRCHHALTWVALMAMLALVVLPTLARALAAQRGAALGAEICTAQGMQLVALTASDDAPPAPPGAGIHLDHCPFCAHAAVALGLPPAALAVLALPPATDAAPALRMPVPHPLCTWRAAQPRAPPAFARPFT